MKDLTLKKLTKLTRKSLKENKKSLRNCNFEGIYIEPFMNFTGVDIRGAKFSDDDDKTTIDRQNVYFAHALYDETTTYNGIPFPKLYGECKLEEDKGRRRSNRNISDFMMYTKPIMH